MKKKIVEGHLDVHLLTSVSLVLSASGICLLTNVKSSEISVLVNYRTHYSLYLHPTDETCIGTLWLLKQMFYSLV